MIKLLFVTCLALFSLFADDNKTVEQLRIELDENSEKIENIDTQISKNGSWVKRYFDHQEYISIQKDIIEVKWRIRVLKKRKKTKEIEEELKTLEVKLGTLNSKLNLLGELGENPYESLIKVEDISPAPEVSNPFAIISAFSYLSDLSKKKEEYKKKLGNLDETIDFLMRKRELLEKRVVLSGKIDDKLAKLTQTRLEDTHNIIKELSPVLEIFKTSLNVYNKKALEVERALTEEIKTESFKTSKIVIFIAVLFALIFLLKMIVKKTVTDTDRVFNIYRVINITSFIVIFLTLTFNYINNLTYFVTVLGFVSAGIAIAMKDWFMNILGWFVIVLGGAMHVGDRVKITKDGHEYVGDILEISLTRVTFLEDITLTSYEVNRRSGRVIMFPNNFIFSSIILNYTFSGLKTVWDGVDIMITFESNHKKAVHIAKELVKKYSKGYTDITRKQVNELRGHYHIRNFSAEPRVFTFIEEYGVKISSWYLTNSYATLTLRSTISSELVEAYNEATDIQIAYPSQTIMVSSHQDKILEKLKKEIGNA